MLQLLLWPSLLLVSPGHLPTAVLEAPGATVMQPGTGSSQAAKGDLRITTRMRADGKTDDGAVSRFHKFVNRATAQPRKH